MFIHCFELLKTPSFENIKLVAGKSGLDRHVSWVYVLLTPELGDWVHGGEILFVVNNNHPYKILEEAVSHDLAGVVFLKNEQNESVINEELINLANKENMPLFEMDYHIKLLDITRGISTYIVNKQENIEYINNFFYNIIFSAHINKSEIDEYAVHFGYRADFMCFVTVIKSSDSSKYERIKLNLQMHQEDSHVRFISLISSAGIIILSYAAPDFINKAKSTLKSAFNILNEKYLHTLQMGMGSVCDSLYDARYSYLQAIKSIPLCGNERQIVDYEELGFPRLLLNMTNEEDYKEYASFILDKIKEHDDKNDTSFLQTMEFYVLNNGNINKASSQLFIHRNTCVYRIAKIKELFKIDLDDAYTRADILNCITITRYFDSIDQ